jgi:SAM-dependent methyltransferase
MIPQMKAKWNNWLASDKKFKKLAVSSHYYLFKHRLWGKVLQLDTKGKFTEIYKHNLWNNEESRSGGGSTLNRTERIRRGLKSILERHHIQSICDAGCGDFNWMKALQTPDLKYIGVDIVDEMIAANKARYENNNVSFLSLDITSDDMPTVDLILCREVLFHLSFEDIFKTIANFRKSKSKYLLTTHFPHIPENVDIETGRCRAINFHLAPLKFGAPIETVEENVSDHCLALWKLDELDLSALSKK